MIRSVGPSIESKLRVVIFGPGDRVSPCNDRAHCDDLRDLRQTLGGQRRTRCRVDRATTDRRCASRQTVTGGAQGHVWLSRSGW